MSLSDSVRRLTPLRPTPLPPVPKAAKRYIAFVIAVYLVVVARAALQLDFGHPRHPWLIPVLAVLLILNQLSAPMRASRASSMNWRFDTTFIVLCALLLPSGWGLLTLWAGILAGEALLRGGLLRTIFNVAQLGVANGLAFLCMQALHLRPTASLAHVGVAILGAGVSYFVSSLLVIVVISLAQSARPRFEVLAVFHFAWLAAVAIGVLIALATLAHIWALPFALAGAVAVYYALEPRLASRWEKEDAQALFDLAQLVSRAEDIPAIEQAVLETTTRLMAAPARLDGEPPAADEAGARLPDGGYLAVAPRPGRRPYESDDHETLALLATLLETARRNVLAREQASEEERGRLLAAVAHEMRTPLTSILGFTQTIRSGRLEDPAPALEQIASAGRQMERLINDLLVLQQAREERFSIEREPVALVDLLEEQIERYRGQSETHQLTLVATEPLVALADRQRLGQVVANLVSNAIKYSPGGGAVELGLRRQDDWARVEVRDHGLGVPEAARASLFKRFFRLGGEHGAIRGSGLGLAIVEELVAAQGGRVGYQEPVDGQGSIFYVELPLA